MHNVQVTPLIGLPQFDGWAHVTTSVSGQVVWALAVSGQHARNVGRDLVDTIEERKVSSSATFYRLISDLVTSTQDKGCNLSLVAVFFMPDKTVFGTYQGSVLLRRQDKVGQVLNSGNVVQVVEGRWQPNDLYILITQEANQFLGEIKQKISQGYESDTIVTSITPNLHLEESTALSALAFIKQDQPPALLEDRVAESERGSEVVSIEETNKVDKVDGSISQNPSKKGLSPNESKSNSLFDITIQLENKSKEEVDESLAESSSSSSDNQVSSGQKVTKKYFSSKILAEKTKSLGTFLFKILRLLLENMSTGFKKVFSSKNIFLLGRINPFKSEIYVGKIKSGLPWKRVLAVLVVLVLLMGGSWWLWQTRNSQIAQAQAQVEPLIKQRAEILVLAETDPIKAREEMGDLVSVFEQIASEKQSINAGRSIIESELEKTRQEEEAISGKETVADLPIFFDLRETDNVIAFDAQLVEGQGAFLDSDQEKLVVLDLSSKQTLTKDLSELSTKDISAQGGSDDIWLLGNSLYRYTSLDIDRPQQVQAAREELETGKIMSVFGEAVYVLNPGDRMIYKFVVEDEELKDPTKWLRLAPDVEFDQISSMSIDGDIWLTTHSGQIVRLRSGRVEDFEITGLADAFSSSIQLFTTEDSEQIYILEANKKRLVILNKEGEFIKEVSSEALASAAHFFVVEENNTAYVVNGSLVYEVGL